MWKGAVEKSAYVNKKYLLTFSQKPIDQEYFNYVEASSGTADSRLFTSRSPLMDSGHCGGQLFT